MILTMARKNYSEQFRRQAVDLYESTPGATLKGIATDLGIERTTLKRWVDQYGTGKQTTADGTTRRVSSRGSGSQPSSGPETPETQEEKIARLEAENAALRAEKTKLSTEREILRQAAKYFAVETRW
jgi:transposase